jgi:hypothetical protein
VLADRYDVRLLRTPREVRNALAYVLLNAPARGEGRSHAFACVRNRSCVVGEMVRRVAELGCARTCATAGRAAQELGALDRLAQTRPAGSG